MHAHVRCHPAEKEAAARDRQSNGPRHLCHFDGPFHGEKRTARRATTIALYKDGSRDERATSGTLIEDGEVEAQDGKEAQLARRGVARRDDGHVPEGKERDDTANVVEADAPARSSIRSHARKSLQSGAATRTSSARPGVGSGRGAGSKSTPSAAPSPATAREADGRGRRQLRLPQDRRRGLLRSTLPSHHRSPFCACAAHWGSVERPVGHVPAAFAPPRTRRLKRHRRQHQHPQSFPCRRRALA